VHGTAVAYRSLVYALESRYNVLDVTVISRITAAAESLSADAHLLTVSSQVTSNTHTLDYV